LTFHFKGTARRRRRPGTRQHLITAGSPIAAGARSAALATAVTSCWPTCSASSARGRRLDHFQHQVNGGRRARAGGTDTCQHHTQARTRCWPAAAGAGRAPARFTIAVGARCAALAIVSLRDEPRNC
jgi:hypothetical protein